MISDLYFEFSIYWEILKSLKEGGRFPPLEPTWKWKSLELFSPSLPLSSPLSLHDFFQGIKEGGYLAFQVFLPAEPEIKPLLSKMIKKLTHSLQRPVTLGWGPRYLHSTGQLHKGDSGHGFFLQLTAEDKEDAPIPDSPGETAAWLTFSQLKEAQARGDLEALTSLGRKVIRIHLGQDIAQGLKDCEELFSLLFPGA